MIKIGILDRSNSAATKDLLQSLCANIPIEICNFYDPLDILIINNIPERVLDNVHLSPKIVIANSDDAHILEFISTMPAKIITYGFNPKAAITASSHIDDAFVICVQRGMATLNGTPILPREFTIDFRPLSQTDGYVMGAVTAALVCGTNFK